MLIHAALASSRGPVSMQEQSGERMSPTVTAAAAQGDQAARPGSEGRGHLPRAPHPRAPWAPGLRAQGAQRRKHERRFSRTLGEPGK